MTLHCVFVNIENHNRFIGAFEALELAAAACRDCRFAVVPIDMNRALDPFQPDADLVGTRPNMNPPESAQ